MNIRFGERNKLIKGTNRYANLIYSFNKSTYICNSRTKATKTATTAVATTIKILEKCGKRRCRSGWVVSANVNAFALSCADERAGHISAARYGVAHAWLVVSEPNSGKTPKNECSHSMEERCSEAWQAMVATARHDVACIGAATLKRIQLWWSGAVQFANECARRGRQQVSCSIQPRCHWRCVRVIFVFLMFRITHDLRHSLHANTYRHLRVCVLSLLFIFCTLAYVYTRFFSARLEN